MNPRPKIFEQLEKYNSNPNTFIDFYEKSMFFFQKFIQQCRTKKYNMT